MNTKAKELWDRTGYKLLGTHESKGMLPYQFAAALNEYGCELLERAAIQVKCDLYAEGRTSDGILAERSVLAFRDTLKKGGDATMVTDHRTPLTSPEPVTEAGGSTGVICKVCEGTVKLTSAEDYHCQEYPCAYCNGTGKQPSKESGK